MTELINSLTTIVKTQLYYPGLRSALVSRLSKLLKEEEAAENQTDGGEVMIVDDTSKPKADPTDKANADDTKPEDDPKTEEDDNTKDAKENKKDVKKEEKKVKTEKEIEEEKKKVSFAFSKTLQTNLMVIQFFSN